MGKKPKDYVKIKVDAMDGRVEELKCRGAMIIFQQKTKMGLFLTGEINPLRMAEATIVTMDEMDPGSEEEDMLIHYLMRVCALATRNEKVLDAMKFRMETAEMIRDILGDEGGADDE